LQTLCILWQCGTHVSLHALACVAPQLRSLELESCRVEAEANPTHFFSLLGELEDLSLRGSEIDAMIGRVSCPRLRELVIDAFEIEGAPPTAHCIDAFSGNCAALTNLALSVDDPGQMIHADGFASLEVIRLDLHPPDLRGVEGWPGLYPDICLPSTLTTLACKTMTCARAEDSSSATHEEAIDLCSMLALAVSSIADGVGIEELRCAHCATFVEGLHDEPGEADFEAFYRPACLALHGLTKLDLRKSPYCSQKTINEIVRYAPDLEWLGMGQICGEAGWQDPRLVHCRNLKELAVEWSAQGTYYGAGQLANYLLLQNSASLESCKVQAAVDGDLGQGDSVTLRLETWDDADISASACPHERSGRTPLSHSDWLLSVFIHDREYGSDMMKDVTISFFWDADKKAWNIYVNGIPWLGDV
jgi:hypothetical protein